MSEQDKAYRKRGMSWLIGLFVLAALCTVLFVFFADKWYLTFSMAFSGGLMMSINFIKLRRMTPEQFEALQKHAKMDNDERTVTIVNKSFADAFFAMLLGGIVLFCALLYTDNSAAAWSVFGLVALGVVVMLISHKVNSGKM